MEKAAAYALAGRIDNVHFQAASIYDSHLPMLALTCFHACFVALFQHLAKPNEAMEELGRVLKPGRIIALCSPDWGGLLIAPRADDISVAMEASIDKYYSGGDAFAGSNGTSLLRHAGFTDINMAATMEREDAFELGKFAASKLLGLDFGSQVLCLQTWAKKPGAMFMQMWEEVIGRSLI